MIKLITVNCPDCGGNMNIEEDKNIAFCAYCGSKLSVINDNERIIRTIDEAEVIRAKSNAELELKKLEIEEQKRKLKIKVSLIAGGCTLFFLLLTCIGYYYDNALSFCIIFVFIGIIVTVFPFANDSNSNNINQ